MSVVYVTEEDLVDQLRAVADRYPVQYEVLYSAALNGYPGTCPCCFVQTWDEEGDALREAQQILRMLGVGK